MRGGLIFTTQTKMLLFKVPSSRALLISGISVHSNSIMSSYAKLAYIPIPDKGGT